MATRQLLTKERALRVDENLLPSTDVREVLMDVRKDSLHYSREIVALALDQFGGAVREDIEVERKSARAVVGRLSNCIARFIGVAAGSVLLQFFNTGDLLGIMGTQRRNLGRQKHCIVGIGDVSVERAESALAALAQIIVGHPQLESELLPLFERLETEIANMKAQSTKLDTIRQLATRATRESQSRA